MRTLIAMILSSGFPGASPLAFGLTALVAYAFTVWSPRWLDRRAVPVLLAGILSHAAMLLVEIGSVGWQGGAARLGFGPVLSLTACLALAVHAFESRMLLHPTVRRTLAAAGFAGVLLAWTFPGEARVLGSAWAPWHWMLGVGSYGLFAVAVVHGLLLDAAERRLRLRAPGVVGAPGVPLLQLERITFRFVAAGFAVLSAAIALGGLTTTNWRWDHKTLLSLVGWVIFALLLAGRHWRGWRGRQATTWLYAGALVLLLAYAGTRFVLEVLLHRSAA